MKPHNEAVSLIIKNDVGEYIAVKRPDDPNDDIAGVWGLPAVNVKNDETHEEAAIRVGRQKLGIEVDLGKRVGDSTHDRGSYTLHLTDYYATIKSGTPHARSSERPKRHTICQMYINKRSSYFDSCCAKRISMHTNILGVTGN